MNLVAKIIKIIIGMALVIILPLDTLLWRIVLFPIIYGLITFYIWYFQNNDSSFRIYFGNGGFVATALSFAFMLFMPIILLSIGVYIASAVFGEIGEKIYSIILMIICYGYFALDIIRIFRPDFLKDEDECSNSEPDSGFPSDYDSSK